jgi:energy-converting hydrogenase A subunit R
VRCTRLDLDSYAINDDEKDHVKRFAEEIVKLPTLEIPKKTRSLRALPEKMRDVVKRLDEIFWKEIPSMRIGKVFSKVDPVGGSEKAAAVRDIVAEVHVGVDDVIYVGDSITDVAAFQLVRTGGGLTVSFNGNSYAVREAEVAVLARNAAVTAVLANAFNRFGKDSVMSLIRDWNHSTLKKTDMHAPLKASFFRIFEKSLPKVERVTRRNMVKLAEESTRFRKDVRGEAVGRLG